MSRKKSRGEDGLDRAVASFAGRYLRGKDRRLHLTNQHDLNRQQFRGRREQHIEHKPKGMWYGFNRSWIDWCLSEQPNWICPYIYEVVVNEERILKVSGEAEFDEFERTYAQVDPWYEELGIRPSYGLSHYGKINYTKLVAEGWHGIEINPYLWSRRLNCMWYYGWDCASGCIWNKRSVLDLRLFARYDADRGKFVKCTNRPAGKV